MVTREPSDLEEKVIKAIAQVARTINRKAIFTLTSDGFQVNYVERDGVVDVLCLVAA